MNLADAASMTQSADGPGRKVVDITFDTAQSDGSVLRGIYNGGSAAATIAVTHLDGTTGTIPHLPAGHCFPAFCKWVNASGTTALASDLRGVV